MGFPADPHYGLWRGAWRNLGGSTLATSNRISVQQIQAAGIRKDWM